ncbi:hypothetical protein Hte_010955 [Hypoxylon texense]
MSNPNCSPSPWPVPDLSLPPKPPTPNRQASVSVSFTPPNTYTYQPTSSPPVSASPSPAPRQPGISENQLSPKNHLRRNERRKQARRNQQPQRLEASPLSPRREAVEKRSRGKRSPSVASLEKYISEISASASGTNDIQATKMASDPLRDYFNLCRRTGKEEFGPDEQAILCSYIGATKEDQRDVVYYLVNSIPCRSRARSLTYKLAFWIYIQDKNYAVVAKLLGERLGDFDPVDDCMMGLREVDELMDCQIALDACRAGRDLSAALAQLLQY